MFKFLLLIFLFFFIVIRVGGFIVKMLFSGFNGNQQGSFQHNRRTQHYRKPNDGNVSIDYMPNEQKGKKTDKNFKGGEYVDYEEMD